MEEVPAGETEVEAGVDVDKILKNYDLEGKELDAGTFDLGEYEDVLKEAGVEDAQDTEGGHADQDGDQTGDQDKASDQEKVNDQDKEGDQDGDQDKASDQEKVNDQDKEGYQDGDQDKASDQEKVNDQNKDQDKTDNPNTSHQDNKPSDDTTTTQFLVCSHITTPFAPLPHSSHLQIYRNAQRLSSVPNPLHCLPITGDQQAPFLRSTLQQLRLVR